MRLVVDSSVIVEGDWHLSGSSAEALLAACRRRELDISIPKVVLQEVVAAHREREDAALRKIGSAGASLRRLQGRHFPETSAAPPAANAAYEADLRQHLDRSRVKVIPVPTTSHAEMLKRALSGRRPFDARGRRGYRDALIWASVLEVARGDRTLFVVADGDFTDDQDSTRLHADLAADLEAAGIDPDELHVVASLEEAAEQALEPARELLEELRRRIREDVEWRERFQQQLVELAESEAYGLGVDGEIDFDVDAEPFIGGVEEVGIEELRDFELVEVINAWALDESLFAVELSLSAVAVLRVAIVIETGTLARHAGELPPTVEMSGHETNARTTGWSDVVLHFEGVYNTATGEFRAIDLRHVQ